MTCQGYSGNLSDGSSIADLDLTQLYPAAALSGFTGIVTLFGNLAIIYVHLINPDVRQTHMMIPALALTDATFGVASLLRATTPFYGTCAMTYRHCASRQSFHVFSSCAGAAYTFFMSGFRLLGYTSPVRAKKLQEPKYIVGIHVLVFLYAVNPTVSVIALASDNEKIPMCLLNLVANKAVGQFHSGFNLLLAVSIIVINILLWKRLKMSIKSSEKPSKRDIRMSTSLMMICCIYVCSYLASLIMFVAWTNAETNTRIQIMYKYTAQLSSVNYASNFFIYLTRSKEFRSTILGCIRTRRVAVSSGIVASRY